MSKPFIERLGLAKKDSGLCMEGWKVWGCSVIKGDDGLYHMFATAWKQSSVPTSWYTDSEIVHAVCENPEGPYRYVALALPAGGEGRWDGAMTHNPVITKYKDGYALFYIGTHAKRDSKDEIENDAESFCNKRIGVALSKSLYGPWERFDKPILEPRSNEYWDCCMTSNPAPYINEDGSVLMIYKSGDVFPKYHTKDIMTHMHGVAFAKDILGPYERLTENYIFDDYEPLFRSEDSYIWKEDGVFHMLAKVFRDNLEGFDNEGGGYHATSLDGIKWEMADKIAYTTTINWDDGTSTHFDRVERVQVLTDENGKATHLFFACKENENDSRESRSVCVPLID